MPEFPYDINAVCDAIKTRNAVGKNFSIVVVGEGARPIGGKMVVKRTVKGSPDPIRLGGISHLVASQIEGLTNIECRVTILGHLLRGGSPTAFDRILATRFGAEAVHMVSRREFGQMVAMKKGQIGATPIKEVAGVQRTITPDHPLLKTAQSLGICLGVPAGAPLEESISEEVAP
jgi:6-phosphofructokinase 1